MGPADVVADGPYYQTYYPQGYHGDAQANGLLTRLWGRMANLLARRKIKAILRLSAKKAGRIRLLDIGCGPGHFLSRLDRSVFEPRGLEPVGEAVEAAKKSGLDVAQGDVLVTPLGAAAHDVVTLWHVLEHISQPDAALACIHAALAPQGLVVIATPNTRSVACRRGREHWFHLDAPRHLHLFNESNLIRLLEKSGFEVVHRAYLPFDFPLDLFWSVRRDWRSWFLLAVYPVAKLFDRENLLAIARKKSAGRLSGGTGPEQAPGTGEKA
ncbi:MAG: class I SAM-dependent methyltransferase [bacterium]